MTKNTKEVIEQSQLSDFDKKEALEYLKHGYILFNKIPYYYKICDDHDDYYDDLYEDADPNYFLSKYIPLCNDEYSKQALINEWAMYWKGEIVPYVKDVINMGWKIKNPLPNIIYISNNQLKLIDGSSPILFIACEYRISELIEELLKNGADPNVSFNYENSLEWVINGHHASYTDCERKSAYESLYECLLILEKYGLKYNLYDEFDDNLSEFINKCPIPDLKKRLESIKFK